MTYFFILLYKITCDIAYKYVFVDRYNYYLFFYDFELQKYLWGWLAVILLSLRFRKAFKSKSDQSPSTYIVFILYLLSFIPTMTLVAVNKQPVKFFVMFVVYWTFLILLEYWFCRKRKQKRHTVVKENKVGSRTLLLNNGQKCAVYYLSAVFVIAFTMAFSYIYTGFKLNLNLTEVYDLRYGEIRSLSGILRYVYNAVGVLMIVFAMHSFQKKNYLRLLVWVVVILFYYSVEGNKIQLFILPVAIIAYIVKLNKRMWLIPFAFTLFNVLTLIEHPLVSPQSQYINGYWNLRMLYLPSNITSLYFDFFQTHRPDYLARSFMRHFGVVSQYDMDIGHIIDIVYYNLDGSGNSNTGLFGDAYANFGDWSVIVYPIILLLVLKLINWFVKGYTIRNSLVFIIFYSVVLQNAAPFTALLTNSLLIVGLYYKFILDFDTPKRYEYISYRKKATV